MKYLAIVLSVLFLSCSGEENSESKEKEEAKEPVVTIDSMAEEFCACKDASDKAKCHDEWVDKYANYDGAEEDGEKLAEKMIECDPAGLMEIAPKLQEAVK